MNTLKNRVQLIGNLGMDPEVKKTENGRSFAKFSLATTESYKGKDGKYVKNTQWHNIVLWGGQADYAGKNTKKGDQIALEGSLVHRNYETKTGEKRYITEVVASDLIILKSKKEEESIF